MKQSTSAKFCSVNSLFSKSLLSEISDCVSYYGVLSKRES